MLQSAIAPAFLRLSCLDCYAIIFSNTISVISRTIERVKQFIQEVTVVDFEKVV